MVNSFKNRFLRVVNVFSVCLAENYFKLIFFSISNSSKLSGATVQQQNLIIFTRAISSSGFTIGVTRQLEKKSPNFSKNSPKSCQAKKGQNTYNKPQYENPKHLHQTTF
jgi:hypothetical protein